MIETGRGDRKCSPVVHLPHARSRNKSGEDSNAMVIQEYRDYQEY